MVEGLIGEEGVIVDSKTGERIGNVVVTMESEVDVGANDLTDSIGYFNTIKFIGCGLRTCDDYYIITLKKKGMRKRLLIKTIIMILPPNLLQREEKIHLSLK